MTTLQRSVFVIPTSSLDDLPNHMGADFAADFLNAWTATWDPRLLVLFAGVPETKRADGHALDLEHALIVCPKLSSDRVDQPLRERLQLGNCELVESQGLGRDQIVQNLLKATAAEHDGTNAPVLVEDFYALGYAILQVQILARKLRYSYNVDWIVFTEQILNAARASVSGDSDETERWLQVCFDSISQERDRYCSQQAYIMNVVMLAESTLGKSLVRQLAATHPISLVASANLLSKLRTANSDAWTLIQARLADGSLAIAGGLDRERPHPYLNGASLYREFARGQRAYADLGLPVPTTYTRFTPGSICNEPTLLNQFGYRGVLLAAWSGGAVPSKDQAKIRWQQTSDGPAIDGVLGHILDASNPESILGLAAEFAKQMDYHQVPTLILAHWPDTQCAAFADLLRVTQRTHAMGKFHHCNSYFAKTGVPYSYDSFSSSAFRIPIASDGKQQNALHRTIAWHATLSAQLDRIVAMYWQWRNVIDSANSEATKCLNRAWETIVPLCDRIDESFDSEQDDARETELRKIEESCIAARGFICDAIRIYLDSTPDAQKGYLVVNPASHSQRVFIDKIPGRIDPQSSSRIHASDCCDGFSQAIIDLPPYGFVRYRSDAMGRSAKLDNTVSSAATSDAASSVKSPSIWQRISGVRTGIADKDGSLANEFMEVQIDPRRGHLKSVFIANKRGSRLSGMLSMVSGTFSVDQKYDESQFIDLADVQMRVVRNSMMMGCIEVTGHAKDAAGERAKVTIRYSLWKGSRSLDIDIVASGCDVQRRFFVWRTAWQNESAILSVWQNGAKTKMNAPLQNAIELIELDDAEHRIYLAAHGLAIHRRLGTRFLGSVLPVDESGNSIASLSLGLDWPRPLATALDQMDSPWVIEPSAAALSGTASNVADSGAWLAQCNLPGVSFQWTDPSPVVSPDALAVIPSDSELETQRTVRTGDACVWVTETLGSSGTARISFFRDVEQAWRVDSQGREFDTLKIVDGQILVPLRAYEQSRILFQWR